MSKGFTLALSFVLLVASASVCHARGGRGGGGGGGGQIRQGSHGELGQKFQGNKPTGNAQNKFSGSQSHAGQHTQPFTPGWYANHPRAWQYTHPHANAWAVATLGAAAAWLGTSATTGSDGSSVVYADDNGDATSAEATTGDDDPTNDTRQYLPLGVYSLSPAGASTATALVQLAVAKDGTLRGTYFDQVSGREETISGNIDKQSQRATWTVSDNATAVFSTSLADLTQTKGAVSLRLASGQTFDWQLARQAMPAPSQT